MQIAANRPLIPTISRNRPIRATIDCPRNQYFIECPNVLTTSIDTIDCLNNNNHCYRLQCLAAQATIHFTSARRNFNDRVHNSPSTPKVTNWLLILPTHDQTNKQTNKQTKTVSIQWENRDERLKGIVKRSIFTAEMEHNSITRVLVDHRQLYGSRYSRFTWG